MFKLIFYVPQSHLETVKNAVFKTGAGKIGNYSHCCWQILGEGQFMPIAGSNPFVGEVDQLMKLKEYKVEMVCGQVIIKTAIEALKHAHPYEEPAYQVIKIESNSM